MLWQMGPNARQNHFLTDMTNSTKVVDFVIQFTVSVQKPPHYTVAPGVWKLFMV